MKKILFILVLVLTQVSISYSQVTPEYKATLKTMFEVSGTEETYKTAIKQLFAMFKEEKKEVPDSIWNEFEGEFLNTSLTEIVDMFAPVYIKYMALEDIQKLIEFYKTPTGVKFAKSTPLIMQESMIIGQEWGKKLGEDFAKRLKKKGY